MRSEDIIRERLKQAQLAYERTPPYEDVDVQASRYAIVETLRWVLEEINTI
jgi:hypothetical protein